MSSRAGRVARVDGTNALERPLNLQHRTNTIFAHRDFRGGLLFDRLGVSAALGGGRHAVHDLPDNDRVRYSVGVWLISPSNR